MSGTILSLAERMRVIQQSKETTPLTEDAPLFIIWGPNPEWADGDGPLAYFGTKEEATDYLSKEVQNMIADAYDVMLDVDIMLPDDVDAEEASKLAARAEARLLTEGDAHRILGWPYGQSMFRIDETTFGKAVPMIWSDATRAEGWTVEGALDQLNRSW